MKKISIAVIALVGWQAYQQSKIAYIESSDLVNDYQEKKDIEARIQVKIDAYEKKRDSLSQAFKVEAEDFDLEAPKMPQAKAQERYNALLQKSHLFSNDYSRRNKRSIGKPEANGTMVKTVKKFIKEYGKQNGYTYILGSNEAGSVLYGQEENNITKDVLKALNEEYAKKD